MNCPLKLEQLLTTEHALLTEKRTSHVCFDIKTPSKRHVKEEFEAEFSSQQERLSNQFLMLHLAISEMSINLHG
jgi:acyl-CoA thioesterase FadM